MRDFTFNIQTFDGEKTIASVFVSAEDVATARVDVPAHWTDLDVAENIYEQRFESALAKAGLSYYAAMLQGVTLQTIEVAR